MTPELRAILDDVLADDRGRIVTFMGLDLRDEDVTKDDVIAMAAQLIRERERSLYGLPNTVLAVARDRTSDSEMRRR